ncbi:MAG: hypothetical protein BroJett022_13620 [Actinomycetes bacterium]|nr:MAG: hypothetical protein BroJett022_13620 [Actinomycetes bacterium]
MEPSRRSFTFAPGVAPVTWTCSALPRASSPGAAAAASTPTSSAVAAISADAAAAPIPALVDLVPIARDYVTPVGDG